MLSQNRKRLKKLRPNQIFVPKVDVYKDYYISKKGKAAKASPTEKTIASVLKKFNLYYLQEVSFRTFGFESCPYRFDFYLPLHGVIIEYDGQHHSKTAVKINDKLKNKFCVVNGLKIFRFNKRHYPKLEFHIAKLLKTLTH